MKEERPGMGRGRAGPEGLISRKNPKVAQSCESTLTFRLEARAKLCFRKSPTAFMPFKWPSMGDNPPVNTLVVAALASVFTAGSIFLGQHFSRRSRVKRIKSEISESIRSTLSQLENDGPKVQNVNGRKPPSFDESLIREQLARNYAFLGDEVCLGCFSWLASS